MAIVIEEQKERFGFLNILLWLIVLIILGYATYYIFFKKPELYEVATPVTLENTRQLVNINLDPAEIIGSPQFQALKQYFTPVAEVNTGRLNPFLGL
jgi:hypothetical protein